MITLAKCWHYDPIDRSGKENCGNCHHWDSVETKCWDHALLDHRINAICSTLSMTDIDASMVQYDRREEGEPIAHEATKTVPISRLS